MNLLRETVTFTYDKTQTASLSGSMRSNSIAYRDVLWEAAVGILLKVVLGEEGRKDGRKEGRREGRRE